MPSAAPRKEPKSSLSIDGFRCGANSGSMRRPRCSRRPRKCSSASPLNARIAAAQSSSTLCRRRAARRWSTIAAIGLRHKLVRLGQLAVEAALEVFGDDGALGLIALVDERQPERERRVVEDLDVL